MSRRIIVPESYVEDKSLKALSDRIANLAASRQSVIYTLCIDKLNSICPDSCNVSRFKREYGALEHLDVPVPSDILKNDRSDWIGFIYQSLLSEGERNMCGQYYTNFSIVSRMLAGVHLNADENFLDPCCGSGAFLMNVKANSVEQLYGVDSDSIAVMIAKANLIAKYPASLVYPQIYCFDFLKEESFLGNNHVDGMLFDYIYTNPPWGISKTYCYSSIAIRSGERASMFLEKSMRMLKPNGKLNFLLPLSMLKIKVHGDVRALIVQRTKIERIEIYDEKIDGVFTAFFSILLSNSAPARTQEYVVVKNGEKTEIKSVVTAGANEISLNGSVDDAILRLVDSKKNDTLSHSVWALGIVTGDNRTKLKCEMFPGAEKIYTGKEICKYGLKHPSKYILYDRRQLQQCAKDEIYRAPEKLVYKFISKNLCFAYDCESRLFLNSANILIPYVSGLSIKTVLAFLNSELFSYYYSKKFADIKILKGNLSSLPFPKLTEEQDRCLAEMVNQIICGNQSMAAGVDDYIYDLYEVNPETIKYIKSQLYGNSSR